MCIEVLGSGFKGSGFKVPGSEVQRFKVLGSRFRVWPGWQPEKRPVKSKKKFYKSE